MMQRGRPIFALIIGDKPSFTFEADTLTDAEVLLQKPWFDDALNAFTAKKRMPWSSEHARIRVATLAEAALYRDYCAEFAEDSNQLLLARLDERSCHSD